IHNRRRFLLQGRKSDPSSHNARFAPVSANVRRLAAKLASPTSIEIIRRQSYRRPPCARRLQCFAPPDQVVEHGRSALHQPALVSESLQFVFCPWQRYAEPVENKTNSHLSRLREIPSAVWALGFVSLLMDTSSEIIHALLPVYLVTALGASMATVGFIEGIAEATASITKVFSGAL